ncbi:MAG: hypothetical protein ACLFT0_02575 [Spirulinaceae cyanobacterium]
MVNTLAEGDDGLVRVNYSNLLNKILAVLQDQQAKNPFNLSPDGNRLLIDLDEIAFQVASSQIENPLGNAASSAKSATVNWSKGSKFNFINQVQEIRDCLKQHLESRLSENRKSSSIEQYVESLATDLENFQGNVSNNISLIYPFAQKYSGLQKQRLSLQSKSSNPLLKFHKVTVTVENTHEFRKQLKDSLENYINIQFSQDQRQYIQEILEDLVDNPKSDFYNLERLMDTEALGKLQREVRVIYLEFLKEHIGQHPDIIYLEDLIRRLRLIEDYINDPEKDDGHYQVNYAGVSVNYRELFSRAEAFDRLPIISLIEGYLGEVKDEDKSKQQFIFGLKLKLGGKVQSHEGETVFDYNLSFLDSNSKIHQEGLKDTFKKRYFVEKVLKIAFLYFFAFAGNDPKTENYKPESDLEYDPISVFNEKVLPVLQGSDESQKEKVLRGIKRGLEKYEIDNKIEKLKRLLTNFIARRNPLKSRTYPRHISVKQGILEQDYKKIDNNNTFFKSVLQANPKAALKYISIGDPNADNTSLCTLPATIQISEIQYFPTEESQSFSLEYDLRKIRALPVLLVPQETQCQRVAQNILNKSRSDQNSQTSQTNPNSLIEFTYNHKRLKGSIFKKEESPESFVYRFTFSLLAYISLKVLLDSLSSRLFVPIVRLHLSNKQNPSPEENFLRSLFSVISHLLNEDHRSNSQGFYVRSVNNFKVQNGLSSLYSILPKKFKLSPPSPNPQLDKLAIIVVSSRECDRAKNGDYKISNLMGEVTGIYRDEDESIRLYTSGTFCDNYGSQTIHSHPDVLIDEVNKLYQNGFKHFLYIAKSPYSNTLNMTRSEEDEELFFMSKAVISSLKGERDDIKIYPIFYDKYYAVKLKNITASSLYIQDTLELANLVEDPSKKAVIFFNLFNGITVGKDRYYNGVISYATLLNIYEGILDDQDLRTGLIYDNPLKNELLEFLTLFHFSRYEAASKINLKLDPYQNIIGDDSVGALSIFPHMTSRVNFNSLAFLTEVKKALNVEPETESGEI